MEDNFNLKNLKPEIRTLKDMGKVLYDKKWQKTADPDMELYFIYRGLKEKQGFRYDITIIFPKMLGIEFNKTKGHQHNQFQEIYMVLEGEAIFLLQKPSNDRIEDVYAVKAKKDDICVIPAGYGHFTINPSQKELRLANWVDKKSENNYQKIQEKQGASYFYTTKGWLKNKNYANIPELYFKSPQKTFPKKFSFLKNNSN